MEFRTAFLPAATAARDGGMVADEKRPTLLSGDHLVAVRQAVADTQRACGMPHLAELTLKGEADQLPMMQAAAAAVERVLKGLFAS
jgi:hypothetical protein